MKCLKVGIEFLIIKLSFFLILGPYVNGVCRYSWFWLKRCEISEYLYSDASYLIGMRCAEFLSCMERLVSKLTKVVWVKMM